MKFSSPFDSSFSSLIRRSLALYATVETSSPRRRNNSNREDRNTNNRRTGNSNGSPALTLMNPLKLQRVVDQIPLSEMPDEPPRARQVASASDDKSGGGGGGRSNNRSGGGGTAMGTC